MNTHFKKTAIFLLSTMLLVSACENNEKNADKNNIPFNEKNEEKPEEVEEQVEQEEEAETETEDPEEEKDETLTKDIVMDPSSIYALVNRAHTLDASYVPDDLVTIEVNYINDMEMVNQLRQEASDALTDLFEEANNVGYSLYAVSGYRSYEYQEELYDDFVATHGEEEAQRFSAPPGASEHQTGLSMDITSEDVAYGLVETFGETDDGVWVSENAHRFGFIIRYPYGKEDVTGYMYEPWHLRYVGKELANDIYESGLAYEEYLREQGIEVEN